jgi:EAL domain-containing protein (putative c-di-GMP-specific phosphodiesterase class I)
MTFNLSPAQLDDPEFVTRLLDRLSQASLEPSRLVAEITETAAMVDPKRTGERLKTLRDGGVRLAIDDFGTGHSSLSRLRDLPADILKIDGSFVRDCPGREEACEMVAAIVDLAHRLGIAALAEGIETEDQRRFLIEQGCLLGQGFRFAPPVPDDRLVDLVLELGGPEPNPARSGG